jgi:Cation transporting ATPase, C-terminus
VLGRFESEPAERGAMRQPPGAAGTRLFSRSMIAASIGQGFVVLASAFQIYAWAITRGTAEDSARAMAFSTIVFGNVGPIFPSEVGRAGAGTKRKRFRIQVTRRPDS